MFVAYLATLVSFLAIDAVWLRAVMRPVFEADVPDLLADQPRLAVAAGFYAFYCMGIIWFAVRPGIVESNIGVAVLNGAILGFMAYGCYEATNLATLRDWTWRMVAIDVAWGTTLTALASAIGMGAWRAWA